MEYFDKEKPNSLIEIRQARDQAEFLRDQLTAEYEKLGEFDQTPNGQSSPEIQNLQPGRDLMRKAITATNRAIEFIDQALRGMERVDGDWTEKDQN